MRDERGVEFDVILDDSEWPVLRVVYPPVVRPDSIRRYVAALEGVCTRGEPYWCLVDLRQVNITYAKPADRKRLAEAVDEVQDRFPGLVQCEACVSASVVVQMLHRAHIWMRRNLPYPSRIFASEEEARGWIAKLRMEARRR